MKPSLKYLKIFANLLVLVLALVVFLLIFPRVLMFFMPFVIGYVISLLANPLVRFLEWRLKMARKLGSTIIIIGVLAVLVVVIYLACSRILEEILNLIQNLPQIYKELSVEFEEVGNNLQGVINRLPQDIQKNIDTVVDNFADYASDFVQAVSTPTFEAAGNFAKNVPSTLIAVIMCLLSAYFFTADRDKIAVTLSNHIPENIRKNVLYVTNDLKHVVGGYFKAQLKIMVVVYVILLIGLIFLRVDYAWLLAFGIAFLDMLPFFGTGTVLGPWAVIKLLSGDYKMAIGLIVLYGVTQLVRQVIQPKIVGDSIGMNPLTTLFFMYIGYKFFGVLGMIIAVPVGMILLNLYREGVFDNQMNCIRELVNDFNNFRKF